MKFQKGHIPWNKKEITWEVNKNGCHICTSHKPNKQGYPLYAINKKKYLLHRFIYEQTYGKFNKDLKVCHKCDNPACINSEHLFLGTQADNLRDMNKKGRHGHTGSKGELHPNSKLTVKQVKEIKILYAKGYKQVVLAEMFNTSQANISSIVTKKSWNHVEVAI